MCFNADDVDLTDPAQISKALLDASNAIELDPLLREPRDPRADQLGTDLLAMQWDLARCQRVHLPALKERMKLALRNLPGDGEKASWHRRVAEPLCQLLARLEEAEE